MGLDAGAGREWLLYWTARDRPVPRSRVPVLAGWADLDQREADAGITARHPILIDPQYRIDPVLARFLAASRFTWLAEGTREAYAKDYRLFFSFLWQRGKYWHEADPDDLLDWESWRRRSQPGRRIGGSKWQRELAALRLLYEWAEKKGRIGRSPVLVHAVRLRDGGTVMAADQAPRDVRCSDVKWVTPRTYRLWRDTGLLGYDISGQPDPPWRGRNDGRNAAFTDLLFSSGLRLREGGCLLTLEVPEAVAGHCYYEGSVAGAVAKRRERMFYASAAALRRVAGYIATTRAEAIRRARRHRRYDQMPGKLIVTKVSHGARRKLCWRDEQGRAGEAPVGAIGPAERMRLFTETEHGLEPLWLWLTEGGTPMAYESWEKVFDAANARVAAVFAAATRRDGRRRTAIACSPHMMRHSFALYMLVALHHALDRRFGLTPEERRHFRQVYGDPWVMVRDLLGHRSEQYRQTRPGTADYLTGEALDTLLRTGDVPLTAAADRQVVARHARALGGAGPEHTWARLFLTMPEAAALTVLLVCDQGWNRSVLDAMAVPDDMPGAGEDGLDIYRVPVLKRRRPSRTRHTSANLVDAGADTSGRLIRQAIEATEPARLTLTALGEPTARLLVARRATPAGKTMFCLGVPPGDSLRRWAASAGLAGDGGPGQVSLRRLRRTVQVLIRREPAQNTARTHEQVYVLRDPATRPEAEQVTAQGLSDAVGHARQVMRMRMLLDAGADQLTDYTGTPDKAQALAGGSLDTATGACLDFHHGPFSPPGRPCTASFLDCLACSNAVAIRRHLPRLAWLHRILDELRGTLDADVWAQDWRTHFLRLTALLEDNTTSAERDAAARSVSDADRELIGQLLTGRYTA